MTIGTDYVSGDLAAVALPDGQVTYAGAAALSAICGGAVKTPVASFNLAYAGQILQFSAGCPFVGDAALLAAIAAVGQTLI